MENAPGVFGSIAMAHRILVAEDDELMRNYLGRVFNWKAWDVVKVADGDQALAQLESKSFDVAVLGFAAFG
jgi:DNA-binding response OmpR family regulator